MTAQQRTAFWTVIATVGAAGIIGLGSLAWSAKADKSDVTRLEGKIDRVLDVLCPPGNDVRVCK